MDCNFFLSDDKKNTFYVLQTFIYLIQTNLTTDVFHSLEK